jgi:hypothetical protein
MKKRLIICEHKSVAHRLAMSMRDDDYIEEVCLSLNICFVFF